MQKQPTEQWINAFLVDRKARNLSKTTLYFYQKKLQLLRLFAQQLITTIAELTPDALRRYLLWLEETDHLMLELYFDRMIGHAQKADFRRVELRAVLHSSSKDKQRCPVKGDDGDLHALWRPSGKGPDEARPDNVLAGPPISLLSRHEASLQLRISPVCRWHRSRCLRRWKGLPCHS